MSLRYKSTYEVFFSSSKVSKVNLVLTVDVSMSDISKYVQNINCLTHEQ